jgi:hypothetical protein
MSVECSRSVCTMFALKSLWCSVILVVSSDFYSFLNLAVRFNLVCDLASLLNVSRHFFGPWTAVLDCGVASVILFLFPRCGCTPFFTHLHPPSSRSMSSFDGSKLLK